MYKNQKGFSAIEGILILVIIGVVGFVGWYVRDSSKKSSSSYISANAVSENTNSPKNNSPAPKSSTKKYSDEFASFEYPSSWKVKRDDNDAIPGSKQLVLTSPENNKLPTYDPKIPGTNVLNVDIWYGAEPYNCKNCKVYDEVPLDNPYINEAKLIFAPTRGAGNSLFDGIQLVTDASVKVGDTRYMANNVVMGSKLGFVSVGTGSHSSSDIAAMKNTSTLKELVNILNTIKFTN
jgi:hypothetical protein